jgi:nitroreductase
MEKPATTDHPILDVIKRRWSPYAFADRPVEPEKIRSLLEAARWSASAFNEQPWRFILATKDNPDGFAKALGCLVEANQGWAQQAPVLILTVTRTAFTRNDKPNRVHQHDLGLAAQNLITQATSMDLFVHQMAGIDLDKVRSDYNMPAGFEPQTAIAIGYGLDAGEMSDDIRAKESSPRSRMPLTDFVFADTWGEPSGVVQDG